MPAEKKYRHRTSITLNSEEDLIKEFKELCWRERKTFSEKLTEFMREELEKNAIGNGNPISITYGCQVIQKSSNTLDYYLEKGFVTRDHFREELKGKPIEHLQRVAALGRTINMVAELEIGFVKTGKYTIH